MIFKTVAKLYPFKGYAYMHQLPLGDCKSSQEEAQHRHSEGQNIV